MIRLIHKETIKDKTKYDYETDNFSTHRRHDIMFTGTGKKQNGSVHLQQLKGQKYEKVYDL